MTRFLSPDTGEVLTADTPHSLRGPAGDRWPVAAGIPYLRPGRDDFRGEALGLLDAGDEPGAIAVLLRDQDPFAPAKPPSRDVARALVTAGPEWPLREMMRGLNFGPVADYFAHRTSVPTYLSGLALLGRGARPGGMVVELACGIGHFLRDLGYRGVRCVGVDLVYAKLWLAKRFIAPSAELVCGDAANPPVAVDGPAVAFCHDAFYFFPDKPAVLAAMRRLAAGGPVLIGHAHNKLVDSGIAGTPLTPAEYADLFSDAALYNDADLAVEARTGRPAPRRTPAELTAAEAVCLIHNEQTGDRLDLAVSPYGSCLVLNPLLVEVDGRLEPRWPSDRFAAEYAAAAGYLSGEPVPAAATLAPLRVGERSPEIDRLTRNRVLVDFPEAW